MDATAFIDIWLLGKSKSYHKVKTKRGSSITVSSSFSSKLKSPIPLTPLQESGLIGVEDGIVMQSMSDSVYDYALALQLSDIIRRKRQCKSKTQVRLFVLFSKKDGNNQEDLINQIANLFRSIMFPIPEIKIVQVDSQGPQSKSKMQWLKWNLLNPRTKETTSMVILTLEEYFDPSIKELKELAVPLS
jgi:hypothetical protein